MARTVSVGIQDFEQYINDGSFYVDKTQFICDWWKAKDYDRPRLPVAHKQDPGI